MEAYKQELKDKKSNSQERIILGLNSCISGHGQSIAKAAGWWFLLVAIAAFVLANDCMSDQWINTRYSGPEWWQNTRDALNGFAMGFLLFTKLYEGREHLSFFIMCSTFLLSAVTWQLLVALRRFSKR